MDLIIGCYLLWIVGAGIISTLEGFDDMAVTPQEIYDYSDMNMFGCVIVFIIGFILNPLFYMAHFICWIFHVGRKD